MWVLVAANSLVIFVVIVALLDGGGDAGLSVAGRAAGFSTLARADQRVAEGERGQGEREGEEKLEWISICSWRMFGGEVVP